MQAQTSRLVPWVAKEMIEGLLMNKGQHPAPSSSPGWSEAATRSVLSTIAEAEAALRGLQALSAILSGLWPGDAGFCKQSDGPLRNPVAFSAIEQSAAQMPGLRASWVEARRNAEKHEAEVSALSARLRAVGVEPAEVENVEMELPSAEPDRDEQDGSEALSEDEAEAQDEDEAAEASGMKQAQGSYDLLRRLLDAASAAPKSPSLSFIFSGKEKWATAFSEKEDKRTLVVSGLLQASESRRGENDKIPPPAVDKAAREAIVTLTTAEVPAGDFVKEFAEYEKNVIAAIGNEFGVEEEDEDVAPGDEDDVGQAQDELVVDLHVAVGKLLARFQVAQAAMRATENLAKALEKFAADFGRAANKGEYHQLLKELARSFAQKQALLKHFAPSEAVLGAAGQQMLSKMLEGRQSGGKMKNVQEKRIANQLRELDQRVLGPLLTEVTDARTEEEERVTGMHSAVRQTRASQLTAAISGVFFMLQETSGMLRREGVSLVADNGTRGIRRAALIGKARLLGRELRLSALPAIQMLHTQVGELLEAAVERFGTPFAFKNRSATMLPRTLVRRRRHSAPLAEEVDLDEQVGRVASDQGADNIGGTEQLVRQLASLADETFAWRRTDGAVSFAKLHGANFIDLARGPQLAARFLATDLKKHKQLRDEHCGTVLKRGFDVNEMPAGVEHDAVAMVLEARAKGREEADSAPLTHWKLTQTLQLLEKFDAARKAAAKLRKDDETENVWHRYKRLAEFTSSRLALSGEEPRATDKMAAFTVAELRSQQKCPRS
eukprot:g2797.t1